MTVHRVLSADARQQAPMFSALRWLALGWADLMRNPVPGLVHGLVFTLVGWLLLALAHDQFWLLAGAYSGFLIVAPIAVSALYAVSRALQVGQRLSLRQALAVWWSLDGRLVKFGLLLGLAGTGWVLTSAGFITLFAPAAVEKPLDFLRHVVLAHESWVFGVWLLLGGSLAAPMFASSVMSIPMLMDQAVGVRQALGVSWLVCASQPQAMGVWALLLMVLIGAAMLSAMLGLIVIAPWLAHASWHAYVEMVPADMRTAQRAE